MARILHHGTAMRDGMHNMTPNLIYWQDQCWMGYRKAEWHFDSPGGTIHVAASVDRRRWREVARLKAPGDNRDAEFIILPDGRLAATWVAIPRDLGPDRRNASLPLLATTDNGLTWSEPQPILAPGHHLFSIREHQGRYYALDCVRPSATERQLHLLVSDDAVHWERLSQVGPDELMGNEAAIWFDAGGRATIIARTCRKPEDLAFIATADAPYQDWAIADLPYHLHCPRVLQVGERVILSSRYFPNKDGQRGWPFGATLGIFEVMTGGGGSANRLELLLHIPATGDSSYSSMIQIPDGPVLLAYYSQHAYHWGVLPPYAAKVTQESVNFGQGERQPMADDIYVAELEF